MSKTKTRFTMGRLLITAGIAVKIFQLVASLWSFSWAGGTVLSMISLCAIAGGLAVFAYERQGLTCILAVAAAALFLLSSVLENAADTSAIPGILFKSVYVGTFLTCGVMLISLRHSKRKLVGAAVTLLGLLIAVHIAGAFTMPGAALICVLLIEYLLIAVGLYL